MKLKYTYNQLKALGYKGYRTRAYTGASLECDWFVEQVAYIANTQPKRLEFTRSNAHGTVMVRIKDFDPPRSYVHHYIKRKMNAEELAKADEELAKEGITVTRN